MTENSAYWMDWPGSTVPFIGQEFRVENKHFRVLKYEVNYPQTTRVYAELIYWK